MNNKLLTQQVCDWTILHRPVVLKTVFYEGSRYTIDPGAVGGGDEEIYYLIRDKNGTTYKLVDENDNVVCEYGYDPFGARTTNTNPAIYNPIGVGGTYFDEETGLYFAQVRYYDAEVGRFTTKDGYLGTATSSISQNRYIYCHQNVDTSTTNGKLFFTIMAGSA